MANCLPLPEVKVALEDGQITFAAADNSARANALSVLFALW